MPTVAQSPPPAQIKGLTHPYYGGVASSYVHAYGHTFRWVKGDRFVAVMRGTCVDGRRVYVITDTLAGHTVLESPQPLVDAIPIAADGWWNPRLLRQLADSWAAARSPVAGE